MFTSGSVALRTLKQFERFNRIFNEESKILIEYSGVFGKKEIRELSDQVNQFLANNHRVCRRVFKIFIEICQNISFYSSERIDESKESGIGSVILVENEQFYEIVSLNKISKEDKAKLVERSEIVCSGDKEMLKLFKKNQLQKPDSKFGGGNIGLVQIALDSEFPLNISFKRTKGCGFLFLLIVQIKKNLCEPQNQ